MAHALQRALPEMDGREINLLTRSKGAALAVHHPSQQSGQGYIRNIYESLNKDGTGQDRT
jgi:hypothetical protein